MPLISVIVPVYNVEKYLKKCVESVLAQTMKEIEIILVDDGSTDTSRTMCDAFAEKYEQIRVIHKDNGGLSSARNAGVKIAEGSYVGFVDSDDYIAPDMYEVLYKEIEKNQADVAVCGVYDVYRTKMTPQCESMDTFVCDNAEMFGHILIGEKISGTVCNKLIRMNIAKKLLFPEGKLFEDAFYCGQLVQHVTKAAVTTKPYYYYVHREGSITTSVYKQKDMDVIEAFTIDTAIVKEQFPQLRQEAKFALDSAYLRVLDKMLLTPHYHRIPEYHKIVNYLKKNAKEIAKSPYFFKTRKIAICAFRIHVGLYRLFLLLNEKMNRQQL